MAPTPTALDVLMEARRLFGRWGQRWGRFSFKRPGLTGTTYCSLGALNQAANNLGAPVTARINAERYLAVAIGHRSVDHWNDGSDNTSHTRDEPLQWYHYALLPLAVLYAAIPFVARFAWHKRIKPVWCTAIKNAAHDQAQDTNDNT